MEEIPGRGWLELMLARGCGAAPKLAAALHCGEPEKAMEQLRNRHDAWIDQEQVDLQVDRMRTNEVSIVGIGDSCYPARLRMIDRPPLALFVRGEGELLDAESLAIVGTRVATRRGKMLAESFAGGIAGLGYPIVSGMARGIDTSAHRGAMNEAGGTVAVMGCGLDVPYPIENSRLIEDVGRRGCLVSEYVMGHPPFKYGFHNRNRIIAGLSRGVLVVEGGARSGALITARWALEQGREVFAVPGPVEHPLSKGPNALLKEGAILVESAGDIVREFGWTSTLDGGNARSPSQLTREESALLGALELVPLHLEEIARRTGSPASSTARLLLRMAMSGKIDAIGGGYYALAENRSP